MAFKADKSFRWEIIICTFLSISLLWLPTSPRQKTLMFCSLLFVLCTELLNTAIERLADKIIQNYDLHIKFIKDVASAAVFLSIIIAVTIWISYLWF